MLWVSICQRSKKAKNPSFKKDFPLFDVPAYRKVNIQSNVQTRFIQ